MARKKQRVIQHEMEEQSRAVVRQLLPWGWVVHDYVPDYGIDVLVEVFRRREDGGWPRGGAEVAGEWFLGQIRSTGCSSIRKLDVRTGRTGKTGKRAKNSRKVDGGLEVEVLSCRVETSLLLTVQAMGSGVPVILFLVTLDTKRVYFVCLNDVIDKCIVPSDYAFAEKKTKTIYVPIVNEISTDMVSLEPLKFLAKRAKLYAAFCRFAYQEREVKRLVEVINCSADFGDRALAVDTLLHFVSDVKRYDFWENMNLWQAIPRVYAEILRVERLLGDVRRGGGPVLWELVGDQRRSRGPAKRSQMAETGEMEMMVAMVGAEVDATWSQLTNLNGLYEEVCRQWFLPTEFAVLASG